MSPQKSNLSASPSKDAGDFTEMPVKQNEIELNRKQSLKIALLGVLYLILPYFSNNEKESPVEGLNGSDSWREFRNKLFNHLETIIIFFECCQLDYAIANEKVFDALLPLMDIPSTLPADDQCSGSQLSLTVQVTLLDYIIQLLIVS
jgi:hypothetical protein